MDNLILELVDIILYEELENKSVHGEKRSFSALSLRLDSERSVFKCCGKSIAAKNNDISFVPQNTEYHRTAKKEKILVFHFNILNFHDNEIKVFSPENPQKYIELFSEAFAVWQSKDKGYRFRATAILYEILAEMQSEGFSVGKNLDTDISKALDIIEKNFKNSDFRISDISKQLYISEAYLRRRFNAQLGISPKKFLIQRRIREAEIMFKSKYYSQTEIAVACGFDNVKYFRYAFKEETGKTISEYKASI